jgi:UDP-N-acetylglucosamine/UDP-N-acetylgalactosamine diphosphorylase
MTTAIKDTIGTTLEKLHLSTGDTHPREPTKEQVEELRAKYRQASQDHVFHFYDSLSSTKKALLYGSLSGIDPAYINEITQKALNPPPTAKDAALEPLPESSTASLLDCGDETLNKWYSHGLELIAKNKVAVVLMAGGQGTRLGSSDPKGCYDIGLPSRKSLFQIQAERIIRVQTLAQKKYGSSAVVPWYVMTSGPTRAATEKFFQEHDFFKLKKENVFIFEQGVLPCVSNDGKILLEDKHQVWQLKQPAVVKL